ncbi:MAG: spondin domain-containing protein [Bacteroidota bacterium]|nr:spondin domain-containing protein [Bacteroidota bacterium]
MKKVCFYILSIVFLISCEKEENNIPEFSEASYKVTITGKWQSPQFVVPSGVHFTTFAGMVHNENAFLWKPGQLASLGVENVAETGNTTALFKEIDSIIAKQNADTAFAISAPSATGTTTGYIYPNSNYSFISFESMIAPSPDWFVGLNGFDLYKNNQWISDTLINLFVYDAGTEEGDVFGYNNPPTSPQQNIELLTSAKATVLANGNSSLAPIATVRFTKQ